MRFLYRKDNMALQQIDVFDGSSQYNVHFDAFNDALFKGDEVTAERERRWLKQHYPDIKGKEIL